MNNNEERELRTEIGKVDLHDYIKISSKHFENLIFDKIKQGRTISFNRGKSARNRELAFVLEKAMEDAKLLDNLEVVVEELIYELRELNNKK